MMSKIEDDARAAFLAMTADEIAALTPDLRKMRDAMIDQPRRKAELMDSAFATRDFRSMLTFASSEDRAAVFLRIEPVLTDDETRTLIEDYWSCTEAWHGRDEREAMFRLLDRVAPVRVYDDDGVPFPESGPVKIFRGNMGETAGAGSWSLDYDIACRFASAPWSVRGRFVFGIVPPEGARPTVWSALVDARNVPGYFNDRGEEEVVITDPDVLIAVTKIAEAELVAKGEL